MFPEVPEDRQFRERNHAKQSGALPSHCPPDCVSADGRTMTFAHNHRVILCLGCFKGTNKRNGIKLTQARRAYRLRGHRMFLRPLVLALNYHGLLVVRGEDIHASPRLSRNYDCTTCFRNSSHAAYAYVFFPC